MQGLGKMLDESGRDDLIASRTGLLLDPYFLPVNRGSRPVDGQEAVSVAASISDSGHFFALSL